MEVKMQKPMAEGSRQKSNFFLQPSKTRIYKKHIKQTKDMDVNNITDFHEIKVVAKS